jgi:hypothetical protein
MARRVRSSESGHAALAFVKEWARFRKDNNSASINVTVRETQVEPI